jgi:hypothetical protein
MPRPRKRVSLDYAAITEALDRGEVLKLKDLAKAHGTCAPVIKRLLEEHYGDSVSFVYGRNGGVLRSQSAPEWLKAKQGSWVGYTPIPSPQLSGTS